VLVALWNCYCSLRTFSNLALVFFRHFTCKLLLSIYWTEDASLTRNRFPSKSNCEQIRLRHPCGVLVQLKNVMLLANIRVTISSTAPETNDHELLCRQFSQKFLKVIFQNAYEKFKSGFCVRTDIEAEPSFAIQFDLCPRTFR